MIESGGGSSRKNPYRNTKYRLSSILFSICLICLSTGIWRPNTLEATITPTPVYSTCGKVSINGYGCVGTPNCIDCSVTHFSWDWGDGIVADSWFPATHYYRANGLYTVTVTAFCGTGETESTSTIVSITTAEDPLCNYALLVSPSTVILRREKTSETLRVELRDADGALVSLNDSSLSFSSSNPAIVQVDTSGVVSGTGFGEAQITVTIAGYPLMAKAYVFAGEFRVEPPILLLAVNGPPQGWLNLIVTNADGRPLNLAGRTVTFHGSNEIVQVNNSGLVTALRSPQSFWETPDINVDIDGIWSHNNAIIRVTSNPLNLNMITFEEPNITYYIAQLIGSFNYQQIFQDFDIPRITNIAYQVEEEVCGLVLFRADMQYLVNDPGHGEDGTVPCGLMGNPVRLGTDVDNPVNSCLIGAGPPVTPQWGVIFHEMGHNFTLASRSFSEFVNSSDIANSNLTYIEGLATAVSMYVGQMMSERATQYQIPSNILSTIMSSVWHFGSTPDLDAYVNSGANYSTISPSVLDDIIMVLADKYGYSLLPHFFSVFLPPDESFSRFNLSSSDANQATFFVAAMSAAAGTDLRSDFRNKWGFPIDNSSFNQVYPQVIRLVAQHEPVPTLTVFKSGTGSGTVTSSPGRINCGTDCSETYKRGTKVTLTAKADANSIFTGWSGDGCSGAGKCIVTMNADTSVTATFSAKAPDISVSPSSLDFGSVKLGKKRTKTLKITNNGSGHLVITLSGLEETDFSIQGSSSVTIKPKKSYSLKVLCKPTSGGLKTVTLKITSNDPVRPTIDIPLIGTGL